MRYHAEVSTNRNLILHKQKITNSWYKYVRVFFSLKIILTYFKTAKNTNSIAVGQNLTFLLVMFSNSTVVKFPQILLLFRSRNCWQVEATELQSSKIISIRTYSLKGNWYLVYGFRIFSFIIILEKSSKEIFFNYKVA